MGVHIDITIHSSDDLPRFELCESFCKNFEPARAGHGKCIFVPWGVFPRMRTKITYLITHKDFSHFMMIGHKSFHIVDQFKRQVGFFKKKPMKRSAAV